MWRRKTIDLNNRGYHDIGGDFQSARKLEKDDKEPPAWASLTDALRNALGRIYCLHEQRRKIEELGQTTYESVSYYEIRVLAMREIAIEKELLTKHEIEKKMVELQRGCKNGEGF